MKYQTNRLSGLVSLLLLFSLFTPQVWAEDVLDVEFALRQAADKLMDQTQRLRRRNPLIAVLDINSQTHGTRNAFSQKVERQLLDILRREKGFQVVDHQLSDETRQEWLSLFPDQGHEQMRQDVGGLLGADWMIYGSYTRVDDSVEFRLELYEAVTDSVIWNHQMQAVLSQDDRRLFVEIPKDSPRQEEESGGLLSFFGVDLGADKEPMVLIPAGSFLMGSLHGPKNEQPTQEVYVPAFRIDKTEVTNAEFQECAQCERGQGGFDTTEPDQPVVYVDWENAKKFCEFKGKRLPTEPEWEKAARGGTSQERYLPEGAELQDYEWITANTEQLNQRYARPVGSKQPNPMGLYDTYGNVMEWVADWYRDDQNSANQTKDASSADQVFKVVRGGAWGGVMRPDAITHYRSAHREPKAYWVQSFQIGFRCAADVEVES